MASSITSSINVRAQPLENPFIIQRQQQQQPQPKPTTTTTTRRGFEPLTREQAQQRLHAMILYRRHRRAVAYRRLASIDRLEAANKQLIESITQRIRNGIVNNATADEQAHNMRTGILMGGICGAVYSIALTSRLKARRQLRRAGGDYVSEDEDDVVEEFMDFMDEDEESESESEEETEDEDEDEDEESESEEEESQEEEEEEDQEEEGGKTKLKSSSLVNLPQSPYWNKRGRMSSWAADVSRT